MRLLHVNGKHLMLISQLSAYIDESNDPTHQGCLQLLWQCFL